MLAIKECLIREGVLNLNPPNHSTNLATINSQQATQYDVNSPYSLYRNRYSFGSHLNMLNNSPKKSATDISVNDLSSTNSATAKTSCQQQQQQQQQSESPQPDSTSKPQQRKLPKRYQGHHPHFHHHTAPAYYTDLHLKIHTPEAKDSVNENYQSVYRTPSKLIKDEHQFPKTITATLPPPLPQSPRQQLSQEKEAVPNQVSFFRGGSSNSEQRQLNCIDPYMASNKRLLKPTKGNSSSPSDLIVNESNSNEALAAPLQSADASVVFVSTNFKPCATVEGQLAVQNVSPRSRHTQRFANRRRAVRVRSESRPISALYDIICKEKGLDLATTSTNDEDSSPPHSNDDSYKKSPTSRNHRSHRSHSRSTSRQPTKSSPASGYNSNMPGGLGNNNSSVDDHPQRRSALQQKKRNDKYSPNTIFINDLSDDEDDEIDRLEGGCSRRNFRLRHPDKKSNLWDELEQSKSSSLPPGLLNLAKLPQTAENPAHNHSDSLFNNSSISNIGNNKVPLERFKCSSGSKCNHNALSNPSLSSNTTTNTTFSVEPNHLHLNSSSSLHDQARRGDGTIVTTSTSRQQQQSQQLDQALKQLQSKPDRNSRKHRRLRDEKPRRHTDGAIKQFPTGTNDLDSDELSHHNDIKDDDDGHQQNIIGYRNIAADDDGGDADQREQHQQQHQASHYHDLNGAGHDFHILIGSAAAAANAKRYITRSQRVAHQHQQQQQPQQEQTNGSRSSPSAASNPALNVKLQLNFKPSTNSEILTTANATIKTTTPLTPVESNGRTNKTNVGNKKLEEEMTNNSGKKSKTTTTVTATTTTKNIKELKIKIPPASEATSTAIAATATAVAAAAAAAADVPNTSCSNTTDKKRDEEKLQQLRYVSPTSPKLQHYTQQQQQQHRRTSPPVTCSDHPKQTASGFEADHNLKISSTNSSPTHRANRKLLPSVSVSMKQNLSETQCTATSRSNSLRSSANSPKSPRQKLQNNSTEYTVKIAALSKGKAKSDTFTRKASQHIDDNGDVIDTDFLEINDLPIIAFGNKQGGSAAIRPRCSTMYSDSDTSKASLSNGGLSNEQILELSPVHKSRNSSRSPKHNEERDKSSKRKSNLNRSLNEEATPDGDDNAMRRRRRRELGMSRPLVPNDDASLKTLISPHKTSVPSPTKLAIRNDLFYHMEMARRGLDLAITLERRKAQLTSLKNQRESPSTKSSIPISRTSKRSDAIPAGEARKERSSEVNRKLNERTRTGLEEIMKIVENVSDSSSNPSNVITGLNQTISLLRSSQERENQTVEQHKPSPIKHATFVQEERIYYEPDPLEDGETERAKASMLRTLRLLKAKSIERESLAYEPVKLSPILRRKSTEYPQSFSTQGINISATPNHIVSILKKKDHLSAGESSSASSNASPVTFSSSVMDTPSKHKRAGILKKRSSLDESRYYSRSHSPDERSILIKSARRNSLEEVANGSSSAQGSVYHGILKQSSYDSSKSDGCPSATREPQQPQSILKKKDSTSTPSDGGDHAPKHVSISQAVILAAAELSAGIETREKFSNNDIYFTPNNEEYDVKPILKLDSSLGDESVKPPKPILKKKSSGDSDEHEIKPILKTSRKSSREEFEFGTCSDGEGQPEPQVKPILKTDSPSKRRSLGEPDSNNMYRDAEQRETLSPFLLKRRTRSLERHDAAPVIDLAAALNAIATSQALPIELVSSLTNSTAGSNISVAERIKSVEKFLANQSAVRSSPGENLTTSTTSATTLPVNASLESSIQSDSISTSSTTEVVKILKPSVIRRDLYKDRFKTQPVTSDERNFFKNNVSTSNNDTLPGNSAFKPSQSLEGLGFAHLSSHGSQSPNSTPSAFTLTRSFTQPLSSSIITPPQSSSSFKVGVPVPLPRKLPPVRSSRVHTHDTANSTYSFSADSSCLFNSNSERMFEMSSLEQDVDMSENQEPKTPSNKEASDAPTSSAAGVVRTNSVKARANMFQQMQEKKGSGAALNREERTSPKRVPRRLSPSPAVNVEETKARNNPPLNSDDEIEPSSLPVSERLRFFSSLSESSKRNSCSFIRSPPFNSIERCSSTSSYHYYMATTPLSSTSLSSASVTPTPTESTLPLFPESPATLRKDPESFASALANEPSTDAIEAGNDLPDSRIAIKSDIVKTSPFLQATRHSLAAPEHVAETEIGSSTALTPTMKRIKLKTIGKLMLPIPFLNNDRNNNSYKDISASNEASSTTDSNGESENSGPPKKIGKIKSPFIESCNQKQTKQIQPATTIKSLKFDYKNKTQNSPTTLTSLENSTEHLAMDISANYNGLSNDAMANQRNYQNTSLHMNYHNHHNYHPYCKIHHTEYFSTDSGKENVDTPPKVQTTPVIEIRRKFTRKANTSQSFTNSTASGITRQLTPRSVSLNGPHSSPQVDDKYAKYFGVATSVKFTKAKQPSALSKKVTVQHRFGQQQQVEKPKQCQAMAINRNVRLWQSSARGIKRMGSVINEVESFEDISFTDEELMSASKQFDRLLLNDSILIHSPKELENIFSSIV